ncbi:MULTISPECIES: polysaccharide biosynthesis/export family protein [unclassified Sphingomonas]|nr:MULTISPECIES: polysaccharide biosynthesis/export family protein [unclassified Sphingomonas]
MILALAACSSSEPPPLSSGDRYVADANPAEAYPLGAGDKIRLTVFNEPTLSGEFSVGTDGQLSLPLIGNVPALGKTTGDVAALVQGMLADGYLRSPRVAMEVINYRPFFILGEVRAPGEYPYVSGLTVLNAVATAQGFTPRARRSWVNIRRFGEQAELRYELTPNLRVWPGDTIRLAERYF